MNLTKPEIEMLKGLFPDGGQQFLESAGLASEWTEVVADIPDAVRGGGSFNSWRVILGMRDVWSLRENWRAAYVFTQVLLKYHQVGAGLGHPVALFEQAKLGAIAGELGDPELALGHLEPAWTGLLAALGSREPSLAPLAEVLGGLYVQTNAYKKALDIYQLCYAMQKTADETLPVQMSGPLSDLLMQTEQIEAAIPFLKESIEWSDTVMGHGHEQTIRRVQDIVLALGRLRRIGEAVYYLDRWHETILVLPESEEIVETKVHMGIAFQTVGRVEEALRLIEGAVRWTRKMSDKEAVPHPKLSGRLITYANLLDQRGHHPEAEGLIREALDVEQRAHGEQSGPVAIRYGQLADYLRAYGRHDEAAGWYEVAVTMMLDVFGAEQEQTNAVAEKLVECLLEMCQKEGTNAEGRERIVSHLGRARHWGKTILGTRHPLITKVRNFAF